MDFADHASDVSERFLEKALAAQARRTPRGASFERCRDCGEEIPAERRRAVPCDC